MKSENEALTTTLKRNVFDLTVEGIDYNILADLQKLQKSKELFFNATDTIKQYNKKHPNNKKRLVDWFRSKRFKEIINIWECDYNTPQR